AVGDRQPGQGRIRPGGAEHEYPVRPRRAPGTVPRRAAALMAGWEVRPRDPRRERQLRLLLVVLVVAVPTAFWAGQLWRSTQLGGILDRQGPLQQRLAEQDQELELLRQRLAVVSSGERLSQQANEQSRQTIKLLEE